jgi:hypothetical protein
VAEAVPSVPTIVVLNSASGDPIGGGARLVFAADNALVDAGADTIGCQGDTVGIGHVWVTVKGDTDFVIDFAAPVGNSLTPGATYTVQEFPSCNPVKGGFLAQGDGIACDTVKATFTVLEASVSGGQLHFAARFEQRCDGVYPPLEGEVRVNATVAPVPV